MINWQTIFRRSCIHSTEDAERLARRRLPRLIFDFIEGAAGREVAARANTDAFDAIKLQPRVMRSIEPRSLAVDFLGQTFQRPFGIAPMGMCNLVWPNADRIIADTSVRSSMPICLSAAASSTLEEMREWAGDLAWFQLYVNESPDAAMKLVDRAGRAGYKTLILTVDVPQVSRRVRDLRNGFAVPFRFGVRQLADFAWHAHWSLSMLYHGVPSPKNFQEDGAKSRFDRNASRAGADWNFLDELRKQWSGDLIVKGINCAEDALRIRNSGVDAIWVSNHGGRQLDSAPPAISTLPKIRAAVGPDYPLIFDSGVRHGEDIARALALGANFVMLGRPILMALAAGGTRGLDTLVQCLSDDLDIAMAQIGITDIRQCDETILAKDVVDMKPVGAPSLRVASAT